MIFETIEHSILGWIELLNNTFFPILVPRFILFHVSLSFMVWLHTRAEGFVKIVNQIVGIVNCIFVSIKSISIATPTMTCIDCGCRSESIANLLLAPRPMTVQ